MSTVTFEYDKTNPLFTLSAYPLSFGNGVFELADKTEGCKKYVALTAAEACFVLGTVVGLIETIFWGAIFLLAKAVHLFIPKSFETATFICNGVFARMLVPLTITAVSSANVVYNFFANAIELYAMDKAVDLAIHGVVKKCEDCLNYQLFN